MTTESLSVTIEGEVLTVEIGTVAAATDGGGAAAWGGITGTLADQTDLNTALGLKAPLASPTFTGTPAAPTAAGATSTTQIATTAFVGGEVTTHAGATDPHGDRAFATSAIATHAAATDPHGDRAYTDGQVATKQAADATLTALAALDSSPGLLEQTGADAFTKRAIGVGASTSIPTRADADTRYAGAAHDHTGTYQPLATVLTNTTASFTTTDETKLDAIEALADVTDAGNVGSSIHGATEKTTIADDDELGLIDSAASWVLKRLKYSTILSNLAALYGPVFANLSTIYQALLVSGTNIKTINSMSLLGSGDIAISGGGSPAGSDTHVQYNDGGAFGGEAAFSYDKTTNTLTISNAKSVAGEALALTATAPAATTGASVAGVAASITAGAAVASTDTAGAAAGGSVTITAGAAARLTSGNANGGNLFFTPGLGVGAGTYGYASFGSGTTPGTAANPLIRVGTGQNGLYLQASGVGVGVAANGVFVAEFVSNGVTWGGGSQPHSGLARQVTASTGGSGSPLSLGTGNNLWRYLTNEGASAKSYFNLPSAAAGYEFTFVVQDADGLRIVAASGDTIRVIDKVTAAAGYIESTTIGSVVTLISINATEWIAVSIHGEWTDGTFTYDDTSLTTP